MKRIQLSGTIALKVTSDGDVKRLIDQDPMGELDKPVIVTIGDHSFVAQVGGYAYSHGYGANVTLYLDSIARPEIRSMTALASEMQEVLREAYDELESCLDIEDGDYDGPKPNWAMRLRMRIDELLADVEEAQKEKIP